MPNSVKQNKIVRIYPENLNKIIALRVINYSNFVFPVLGFSHKRTNINKMSKKACFWISISRGLRKVLMFVYSREWCVNLDYSCMVMNEGL